MNNAEVHGVRNFQSQSIPLAVNLVDYYTTAEAISTLDLVRLWTFCLLGGCLLGLVPDAIYVGLVQAFHGELRSGVLRRWLHDFESPDLLSGFRELQI